MTCGICRKIQADGMRESCPGIDEIDICPRGEVPKLKKGNTELWFLFAQMLPGLWDGQGFDYYAIDFVLDAYEVPDTQRPEIRRRCLMVIPALQEIITEQRKKQSKNG